MTEELEKEAEEYAFTHWADTDEKGDYLEDDVLIKEAYLAGAEPREKRIAELEKENAELKSGCGMCYRKDKENLTKAKELLKFWVDDFYDAFNSSKTYEERHKAIIESEQFLKENEK